jgi:hypothetical protein
MRSPAITTFGWFPPQILDRWGWALRVERRLEACAWLRPVLPFRLIQSQVPSDSARSAVT